MQDIFAIKWAFSDPVQRLGLRYQRCLEGDSFKCTNSATFNIS